jgi:hypothetical protein
MAYQIGIVDKFYFLLLPQWTIRSSDKRSVIHRFLVAENQTSVQKNTQHSASRAGFAADDKIGQQNTEKINKQSTGKVIKLLFTLLI